MINFRNNPNQDTPYNDYGPPCEHGYVGRCSDCEDQKIKPENKEWAEAFEQALDKCPAEFIPELNRLAFLANNLINETRFHQQIDAAKNEIHRRVGSV